MGQRFSADTFALASAIEHSAAMVTGDPEFRRVEALVEIIWIYSLPGPGPFIWARLLATTGKPG